MSYMLCYSQMDCVGCTLLFLPAKFMEGIDSFMKVAMGYMTNNVWSDGYIQCLCVDCKNQKQF